MRTTSQAENDILFVSVTGDIDMWNAKKFKENLYDELWKEKIGGVRLDMRDVNYMDSSGLGVLFAFIKAVKKMGKIVWVTNLNDKITSTIVLAGMDKEIFGVTVSDRC